MEEEDFVERDFIVSEDVGFISKDVEGTDVRHTPYNGATDKRLNSSMFGCLLLVEG